MTCKDCLHYEVCALHKECDGSEMSRWECFTDKSEWVHLPLKVEDEVYCFEPDFEAESRPKLHVVKRKILNIQTFLSVCGGTYQLNDIGKYVFLTQEAAEKVIEEMRKQYG